LGNSPFSPISASGSNFNPQNTVNIPVAKISAFLELEQKLTFSKGLIFICFLGIGQEAYIKITT
jgi:hypothetical protein